MGSPDDEKGRSVDEYLHRVRISHAYYLAKHEVTVGQFERFVEATGYQTEAEQSGEGGSGWSESTERIRREPKYSWSNTGFPQTDKHPVVNVSRNDAVAFCEWLGRQERFEYGLPTESQWEYACRAGSDAPYSFGGDGGKLAEHANVADRTAKLKFTNYSDWAFVPNLDGYAFTALVGNFQANAWGLHDVHGNVWEFCRDWYDAEYYKVSPKVDPDGPPLSNGSLLESEEQKRVCRGGGWSARTYTEYRSASRIGFAASNRSLSTGFRVMRTANADESAHDSKVMSNGLGMKLVLIPAGEFMMGSHESPTALAREFGADASDFIDEYPLHRVVITRPFYMAIYEVTRGEFARFVTDQNYVTEPERDGQGGYGWNEEGGNFEGPAPKYSWRTTSFEQNDEHPAVNITWHDAVAFCSWLNTKEGQIYRLPTEAEWEYSCRAETTSLFHFGDAQIRLPDVGNVGDEAAKTKWTNYTTFDYLPANDGIVFTAKVGQFGANAFGLFDMHGNVWEWCQDSYDGDYYANAPTSDPPGPTIIGQKRVLRGGSWLHGARHARSANRSRNYADARHYFYGFRVLLETD